MSAGYMGNGQVVADLARENTFALVDSKSGNFIKLVSAPANRYSWYMAHGVRILPFKNGFIRLAENNSFTTMTTPNPRIQYFNEYLELVDDIPSPFVLNTDLASDVSIHKIMENKYVAVMPSTLNSNDNPKTYKFVEIQAANDISSNTLALVSHDPLVMTRSMYIWICRRM
jgi:hypothetical protein